VISLIQKSSARGLKEEISMKEKVEEVLGMVRPMLVRDGGDVELVGVDEDGTVSVKLKGACNGCAMASMTLKMGIEKILKQEIPEVKEVVAVD
jgi:Fe-S cluster biogenesis protein NfuA